MATITTAAAGNWSQTGTWTGAVLPGLGDVAKINHQVTVDGSFAVGGIDPTGSGILLSDGPANHRILVGGGNGIQYVAKGLTIS